MTLKGCWAVLVLNSGLLGTYGLWCLFCPLLSHLCTLESYIYQALIVNWLTIFRQKSPIYTRPNTAQECLDFICILMPTLIQIAGTDVNSKENHKFTSHLFWANIYTLNSYQIYCLPKYLRFFSNRYFASIERQLFEWINKYQMLES